MRLIMSMTVMCLTPGPMVHALFPVFFAFLTIPLVMLDLVQPKTSTFSTFAIILVHYKFLHQLYQPIFGLFSNLNSSLHNLVIGLCSALKII